MPAEFTRLRAWAREEIEAIQRDLPPALLEKAQGLPVTFQDQPNRAQLQDGLEPDTLGLFVGPEFAHEESTAFPIPAQIILFLRNLWDFSEGDEEIFREEARTTYLHELGHYLGLDEDDLFDRGLD